MNESNSIETIDRTNFTGQTKIILDKIYEIENYFYQEINQIKLWNKKLSKYVAAFDYIDKVLIVLSAITAWSVYHFFYKCCWGSCRISKCKFYSNSLSSNRNNQKITKHSKKQKEKT